MLSRGDDSLDWEAHGTRMFCGIPGFGASSRIAVRRGDQLTLA